MSTGPTKSELSRLGQLEDGQVAPLEREDLGMKFHGLPLEYDLEGPSEEAKLFCARVVHVAVEAINKAIGEQTLPWELSKESLMIGINRMLENPSETPDQNHRAWMQTRIAEGWIYGDKKDIVAKTHPCLVAYDLLPPIQQAKDMIFMAVFKEFFP